MSSIVQFIRNGSFDPETIELMSVAYDKARAAMHDRGQPVVVQEVIAGQIMAFAARGERDPEKLAQSALQVFGIKPD